MVVLLFLSLSEPKTHCRSLCMPLLRSQQSLTSYRAVNVWHNDKHHNDCCPQSPSGGRYNSSSYGDGQYHWLVPNPVEEGSYTCLIPSRYVHVLCLPPGTSQGPEATLAVDDLKVRMMLMEAQQRSLQQNVTILQQENVHLQGDNQRLAQNLLSLQQHVLQLETDSQQVTAFSQGKWKLSLLVALYCFVSNSHFPMHMSGQLNLCLSYCCFCFLAGNRGLFSPVMESLFSVT